MVLAPTFACMAKGGSKSTKLAGVSMDAERGAAPSPVSAAAGASLEEILGQPRALAALRKALSGGRLHHAYVFHGPQGVGKFTAACAFGRALL